MGRKGILKKVPSYTAGERVIWVHASSVGEFEQAKPLLRRLKASSEPFKVHVTFFSPSGYEVCKKSDLMDSVSYLPLDTAGNFKKFLEVLGPEVLFLTKYDFWYHMIHECKKAGVPVISYASIFRSDQVYFKKQNGFGAKILKMIDAFYVQNEISKSLLKGLDISAEVIGDSRFDQVENVRQNRREVAALKAETKESVILLGSAWEDDVELWLPIMKKRKDLKFLIAPHEVEGGVIPLLNKELGGNLSYFSQGDPFDKQVYIMDAYGYLSSLYYYCSVAYVGGGFNKSGVHNTLEAAIYGKPIIIGPHYVKFQEVHDLLEVGSLKSVSTTEQLEEALLLFNEDKENRYGDDSRAYAEKHLGATDRMLDLLETQGVWKV